MQFRQITTENPVIKRLSDNWIYIQDKTFTLDDLESKMEDNLGGSNFVNEDSEASKTIDAMLLEQGQTWKKGKVRFKLVIEFAEGPETEAEAEDSNWPPLPID